MKQLIVASPQLVCYPVLLKVTRKAPFLYNKTIHHEPSEVKESRLVSSYAFAVSEENASGGIIVTAPTCGACGVLPAVIRYMAEKHPFITSERVINALAVAGLIGNLIKTNASISGAVCGCQAEIGFGLFNGRCGPCDFIESINQPN